MTTRQAFERTPWVIARDGYPANPRAQPDCPTCMGLGVVDTGEQYGCILALCPDCWKKEQK